MADSSKKTYTTGVSVFDELFGPMHPGGMYLLVGRTALNRHMIDRLAVLSASRGDATYYIDGGHRADPFSMARVLRLQRQDPRPVLERVRIARAFTAHQMDSLIRESLFNLGEPPELLIVTAMDSLLSDPEVDRDEARAMLRNCMTSLKRLAGRGACVVIGAAGGSRESELLAHISPYCINWASLTDRFPTRVRIVTRGGLWQDFTPLNPFQTMLEDFGSAGTAEEVG